MTFYNLTTIDYTWNTAHPLKIVSQRRYCDTGIHIKIKHFIETTIGIPWDEELELLEDFLSEIGVGTGYIGAKYGQIVILKPLPDINMYDTLMEFIGTLYNEDFCKIIINVIE